jgi:CheY-like chemotaxis protein
MRTTILVVDDEPSFRELIVELLSTKDYQTISAHDGSIALTLLKTLHVDIIISDIEMPVMDGIAFHASLQQDPKKKFIPFVFLTGSDDPKYFHYVDQHPPAIFLRKEHIMDNLLSVISSITAAFRQTVLSHQQSDKNLR